MRICAQIFPGVLLQTARACRTQKQKTTTAKQQKQPTQNNTKTHHQKERMCRQHSNHTARAHQCHTLWNKTSVCMYHRCDAVKHSHQINNRLQYVIKLRQKIRGRKEIWEENVHLQIPHHYNVFSPFSRFDTLQTSRGSPAKYKPR